MASRGLAHTTTKEIARAAGYSEATLYKTFADKVDLFLCVLVPVRAGRAATSHRPGLGRSGEPGGPGQCGGHPGADRRAGAAFYAASFPISASLFDDGKRLARHREAVLARGTDPARMNRAIAEQRAGRIAPDARPEAVTSALVGGCFQRAFLLAFTG